MSGAEIQEGDTVCVRVRENRTSGPLQAKFVADVAEIQQRIGTKTIVLDVPWASVSRIRLKPYEATFEQIDDHDDVSF
jgi:hypothetical protein